MDEIKDLSDNDPHKIEAKFINGPFKGQRCYVGREFTRLMIGPTLEYDADEECYRSHFVVYIPVGFKGAILQISLSIDIGVDSKTLH